MLDRYPGNKTHAEPVNSPKMFIGKHAAQRKHASRHFDFLIVNSVMLKRYRNKAPLSLKGEIIKG